MGSGLQEGEIRQAIEDGGHIRNVLVVSRRVGDSVEYLAYLRPSWKRDLLPLRTWGDKADRTYRDLDRLLMLIRQDFRYEGVVPVYVGGDPELARYKALAQGTGSLAGAAPPPAETDGLATD